jgi:steroid 5-alpha reductase family enzyme
MTTGATVIGCPGVLTVLSPVVMTYFLVYATGARLLEKSMSRRPGYPEYQARTSYFLPRPPRSRGDASTTATRPRP